MKAFRFLINFYCKYKIINISSPILWTLVILYLSLADFRNVKEMQIDIPNLDELPAIKWKAKNLEKLRDTNSMSIIIKKENTAVTHAAIILILSEALK